MMETAGRKVVSENNKVFICGRIEAEPEFSHESFNEKFYRTRIRVERFSGVDDLIPLMIPESLMNPITKNESLKDKWVAVSGQMRSFDRLENGRNRLDVYVFPNSSIKISEDGDDMKKNVNIAYFDGYICKSPVFRKTPFGRQITDIILSVNRPYGRCDYLPCIAWEKNAQLICNLDVGTHLEVRGRLQSRQYFKKYSPDSQVGEYRMTYEMSIKEVKVQEEG